MKTLVIRQSLSNGVARTWRLRPDEDPVTLGSSRLAKLTSMDPASKGIEGAFEFHNGKWSWLNLNHGDVNANAAVLLDEKTVVKLANSEMRFTFIEKDAQIFDRLAKSTAANVGTGTSPHELEIVKFGEKILSTKVMPAGSKHSKEAEAAKAHGGDQITVLRRPVHLGGTKEITSGSSQSMDSDSKRGAIIIAVCTILFSLGAFFGPKGSHHDIPPAPPAPQKITVTTMPMKVKIGAILEKKKAIEKAAAPSAGSKDQAPGGKVAGLLKSVTGGRISTLLGKVSAQAARSREVIVQQGIKAGEGPSGRALAALGKIDKGGGDWSNAASGTGVTVSTNGKGGGKNLTGTGLSAGNVGKAGVGLIEDESEISGGLDRDVIAQTIKSYLGQVLYCYERQLSANPDLFGKVAIRFTIGPTGGVEAQKIGDTTLKNATVEGCILTKVAGWKFPAPSGGTKVMVTYPFLFKSTN